MSEPSFASPPPLESRTSKARSKALQRFACVLLPLGCGTALSTLLFHMARDPEIWARWSNFFPFALRPVFHDLWITVQHLHEADLGLDPLSNPNSEFAYPRAVLLLRHLGIHHIPVEWLGFIQGILLTLAVVMVLRPVTPLRAIATSLLFFSPPLLLGLERANLDFPLFFLCAVAAWHWARTGPQGKLGWPIAAAIAGSLLKLYPIFALVGGALAETGRRRVVWLGAIALVLAYWKLNHTELVLIMSKISVSTGAAWGCLVFFARLERLIRGEGESFAWLVDVSWPLVAVSLYFVAGSLAAILGFRLAPRFSSLRIPRFEWASYWVGALICCGSFIGANLAYRWVFVLLTLPLLVRAIRSREPVVALWSRATTATILVSLGSPLVSEGALFALLQGINWLCILLLVFGCTALRVTAKSPVFAFFLRVFAPRPPSPVLPADVEGARAGTR